MRAVVFILFCWCFNISAQTGPCLNFSTFFGKINQDEVRGLCTDNNNNTYVIGNTYSTNLPVTAGAFQDTVKGNYESFIAKFDSCGYLVWCSYFGTSGFDSGEKIAYSSDNTIVFCGYTNGTNLAVTPGCYQPAKAGAGDCFIAKFTLAGAPVWITYFGGTLADYAYEIKTDSKAHIFIGGTSLSTSIHTSATSFQQNLAGATDAFISRFDKNGNLKFSTFYGGASSEDVHALATDKNGNVIAVGGSFSNNLSTSTGCFQSTTNGGMEVYVVKLDSLGQRVFSTYVGDNGTDDAFGVCTDQNNNIYVSGHTNSLNFYTSTGAYKNTSAGNNDAYCFKMDPLGQMQWSTYFGGALNDFVARMTIDNANELTVLLSTESTDFPMLGASTYTALNVAPDIALMKFMSNGVPFWSTYLGGSAGETPHDIACANTKKVVIGGATASADFPLSGYIYQNTFNGTEDGHITWFTTPYNPLSGIKNYENVLCKTVFSYQNNDAVMRLNDYECNYHSRYAIYNVLGEEVKNGRVESSEIILNTLPTGVYFLRLEGMNSSGNYKFVKD